MNSAIIGLVTIIWLILGYVWYGRHIQRRLVDPDDTKETPANRLYDNVDYKPAPTMVLFGHHFSSIAGAGPIIGPIIAVAFFGWGVSFIWILLAVVFMGAVHDYLSLMVSVRHDGRSIPDVAGEVVGGRSRVLFQIFVWMTLVLVIAAFIDVAAASFVDKPQIVIASLGLIPWAVVFGLAIYRRGVNLVIGTVVALVGLAGLIYVGYLFPISFNTLSAAQLAKLSEGAIAVVQLGMSRPEALNVWYIVLSLYGLAASVMPVWLLLQPRDYIANWILIVGMGLGFLGLFVSHPAINATFFTSANTAKGPIWPMLFILIACGAISGFHSIVASGTTAKQLTREGHGLVIGFGAMLTEGLLAILALLAVSAGIGWDRLQQMVVEPGGAGAIVAFGEGFGNFVDPLVGVAAGTFFGVTMINAFVMTTLDTSVRLARFVASELGGGRVPIMKNRYVASLFAIVPAYLLVATGSRELLWPMFATANQLVAGLALIVISAYLVGVRRPVWYTLLPAILMLTTTVSALVYQSYHYLLGFDPAKGPNVLLGGVALVLLALAIVVVIDAARMIAAGRLRASRDAAA